MKHNILGDRMLDYRDKTLGNCWNIWTLSDRDFRLAYEMKHEKPVYLTDEEKDEVARKFRKGVEVSMDWWADFLVECIEDVRKECENADISKKE